MIKIYSINEIVEASNEIFHAKKIIKPDLNILVSKNKEKITNIEKPLVLKEDILFKKKNTITN